MSSFRKSVAENLLIEIENATSTANWLFNQGEEQVERYAYCIHEKRLFVDFAIKQFNLHVPQEMSAPRRAEMVLKHLKIIMGE